MVKICVLLETRGSNDDRWFSVELYEFNWGIGRYVIYVFRFKYWMLSLFREFRF